MEILAEWNAGSEKSAEESPVEPPPPCPRAVTADDVEAWLTERIAARLHLAHS
jgi:hypothetical protein